tara:strand:- start:9614 stop:9733 length:120 start_codon:yes stop_codon:yes gene_type:complete
MFLHSSLEKLSLSLFFSREGEAGNIFKKNNALVSVKNQK